MRSYKDKHTKMLLIQMDSFQDEVYAIEDELESAKNKGRIIEYLNDIRCSMPLGLALRRHLCQTFAEYDSESQNYIFKFENGFNITVSDYKNPGYNIENDDLTEYTDIFMFLSEKFNPGCSELFEKINRAEARRLLKVKSTCKRDKMFLIGFALHMDSSDMYKFLTDVLAEQTYNYRHPHELIAYYCQCRDETNNYNDFLRIKNDYESLSAATPIDESKSISNYTEYAKITFDHCISNEAELIDFLIENRANFNSYSQTAYKEYMKLFYKVMSKAVYYNKSGLHQPVENTEQLAKSMLDFIPRVRKKRLDKDGNTIYSEDFKPIKGNTSLPNDITQNLWVKDRLDDLQRQIKPVSRKDLVYMKFYLLHLETYEENKLSSTATQGEYRFSSDQKQAFIDETNNILQNCGMSRLYPANRFENLILMSLFSNDPFNFFSDIMEYSFNEDSDIEQ